MSSVLTSARLVRPVLRPRLRRARSRPLERTVTERELFATFELTGLLTHDREPGSDEWDDLVRDLGNALVAAVGTRGRAYQLGPTRFAIRAQVEERDERELVDAAEAALTDGSYGVAITGTTLAHSSAG